MAYAATPSRCRGFYWGELLGADQSRSGSLVANTRRRSRRRRAHRSKQWWRCRPSRL